jgi:hypothetical protein
MRGRIALGMLVGLVAACSKDSTGPGVVGTPTATVALAPGEYALYSDTQIRGAVRFPAAGATGAQYLVVGQFATANADFASSFSLGGASLSGTFTLPQLARRGPALAQRFHDALRSREADFARRGWQAGALRAFPAPRAIVPPTVGQKKTFRVCANIDCNQLKNVLATAQTVGQHAAIFLDDSVPAGGFSAGDITTLSQQFDQVLFPIDTARFGPPSDIDSNGVVIVLLTKRINALVTRPACDTSFITGFFFGGDIAPGFATQYNNGEIFYGMVPDPAGTVSCAYSTSFVSRILPVTFIHEFQHMISFNQHVLRRGGDTETLWLNEAMSHLAEELAGLHYDSLSDNTTASRFYIGDLFNAYLYLSDPASIAIVTETAPGSLEQRGGAWLFLRYLVDRFGANLSRALDQTVEVGALNVQAATGQPFETLLGRWALAVYLTDAPGFTPPPDLQYALWNFRTTYLSLHSQDPADFPLAYPLVPRTGLGGSVSVSGNLNAGSGAYLSLNQLANGPEFDLFFRGAGGGALPALGGAQVAVARIR